MQLHRPDLDAIVAKFLQVWFRWHNACVSNIVLNWSALIVKRIALCKLDLTNPTKFLTTFQQQTKYKLEQNYFLRLFIEEYCTVSTYLIVEVKIDSFCIFLDSVVFQLNVNQCLGNLMSIKNIKFSWQIKVTQPQF